MQDRAGAIDTVSRSSAAPGHRARALVRAAAIACLAALAVVHAGREAAARDLRFRIGGGGARLEGALGGVYPHSGRAATFGVDLRFARSPWRLRTGAQLGTRSGSGDVPVTGWIADSTGLHEGLVGSSRETWATDWIETPVVLEWNPGRGPLRPYAGAGVLPAARLMERERYAREVPASAARRVTLGALLSAGVETRRQGHVLALELGWEHGLQSLYLPGRGPAGSWSNWTIAMEVGL